MSHLSLKFDELSFNQAWLMLCHARFIGICKEWNDPEGSGLISMANGTAIKVQWTDILFVGDPLLIPSERLEFGIILDTSGNRKAIYVTGPNGYYLNSNRWPNRLRSLKHKLTNQIEGIMHEKMKENKEGSISENRSETKHLIQRLSGNMHPNGQLDENSKSTLKQWLEEDSKPATNKKEEHIQIAQRSNVNNKKKQQKQLSAHIRNEIEEKQFDDEMNTFYRESRPNASTKRDKFAFYLAIRDLIEAFHDEYYPLQSWSVFKFGSIVWGIDNIDSDIDVAIKINTDMMQTMHKYTKQDILQRLSCFIEDHERHEYKLMTILHARWPIIRIEDEQLNIQMDISISNDLRVKYTKHIILEYIDLYTEKNGFPMKKLIVLIKYWAKKRCINDSPNRFINSFGFTLMTIKYVQHLIYEQKKYINLSHLLYGFFVFYGCTFDATQHAIDIMDDGNGAWNEKMSNKVLEIIDPANIKNNVTNNVRQEQYATINTEFKRALQIYKVFMTKQRNQTMHISLFNLLTEPGTKMTTNYDSK